MSDSTPTTTEELIAGLDAVGEVQQPMPWDVPYFWPRQIGLGPTITKVDVAEDNTSVTLVYDDVLSAIAPTLAGFDIYSPHTMSGSSYHLLVTDSDFDGDYSIILETDPDETTDIKPQLNYTPIGPNPVKAANNQAAQPQSIYLG